MTSVLTVLIAIFSANAQDWQGFKKVEGSTDVPHAEVAMTSVFKLQTFNAATEAKFEIVNVEKQKQITNEKTLDSDYRALQIETCRRYGISKCPVSTRLSTSTVVLNGGNKLQGCRHSFHNWMAMATKVNGLSLLEIHVPMIISNYKGEVIYNSAYSPAEASVGFLSTADRLNIVYEESVTVKTRPQFTLYAGVSDYITFNFDDKISDSATLTHSSPSTGPVYIYGYPAKTKYYGGVKKGDAPGDTLVSSSGSVTEYNFTRKQIITNSPTGPGMSGGAMLSTTGILLGISCAGDKTGGVGLAADETALTEFWKKLEALPLD